MENTFKKAKKKKTRKCLDELRNRSKKNSEEKHKNKSDNFKTKNLNGVKITKDRLTLKRGIFAKSVRSETITRPVSEDFQARLDENLYKIIDLANGRNKDHSAESIQNNHGSFLQASTSKKECSPMRVNSREVSPLYFSPNRRNNIDTQIIHTQSNSVSSSSSDVDSSIDDFHYELYSDFTKEIPQYLSQHVPSLMKDNVLQKTKKYLQTLYKESCERESESNILECINRTSKSKSCPKSKSLVEETMEQSVLLNPIQYIKQGYQTDSSSKVRVEKLEVHNNHLKIEIKKDEYIFSSDENSNDEATHSDKTLNNNSEPNDNDSSTETLLNHMNKSPECIYYPHKLN